jgi:hypothetical protein
VRHAADQARLDALRAQAAELGLCAGGYEGSVEFQVSAWPSRRRSK